MAADSCLKRTAEEDEATATEEQAKRLRDCSHAANSTDSRVCDLSQNKWGLQQSCADASHLPQL
eukprot:5200878-Amphidinium_carterae.1